LEQLSARLDEQFSRLTQAVGDVRQIAEASLNDKARLDALESYMAGNPAGNESQGAALADLSEQVRAVRDAITAMPAPDAIKSLEDGYNHVLARLDTLKTDGASDQKIDALYDEVTGLRELLDQIRNGGMASVVEEMRAMMTRLENEPGADSARIAQALESATAMAEGQGSAELTDAIGAVVERLVALEARIEALAAGADDGPLTSRLDAIQSEMSRLATFQDEAKGLSQALDAVRDEVRSSNGGMDWSAFERRFGALDRIEQMTGGYAEQISSLSERLNTLDGSIANQGDMARQVSALSRQVESFTNAMPVREIEQAVLELTGRVTALQEDTGTERLAVAVRELGERVESCIRSIPKTETIIEAVEAKIGEQLEGQLGAHLSTAMEPMIDRLDSLHTAITDADGPLIEHMAGRLESLISAMPTPRAEDALSALEQHLAEINQRQESAGVISREDVTRLHSELTRARASVELGSNRDLQRAIVDQVRHLADRFENARASGDATILPEVEEQIEALAGRVQALGLFDAPSDGAHLPDDLIEHIDQRLDDLSAAQTPSNPGFEQLHEELAALRRNAGDQDLRMQKTLENMQQAMETVGQRISALESDEQAALNLAESDLSQPFGPQTDADRQSEQTPVSTDEQPDTKSDGPDEAAAEMAAPKAEEPEEAPAPGDAQDLLRQLTGAINTTGSGNTDTNIAAPNIADPEPTMRAPQAGAAGKRQRAPRVRQGAALTEAINTAGSADAANQRASFIAAARRAAQSAALQATGPGAAGRGRSQAAVDPNLDPFAQDTTSAGDKRTEPSLDGAETLTNDGPPALTPAEEFGGAARNSRIEQKKNKKKEAERQKTMSRAMLFALVLFTIGLAGFVVTLILPADSPDDIAPLAAIEAPADLEAQATQEVADEPATAADNDPRILATEDATEPVRVVGEGSTEDNPTGDTGADATPSNVGDDASESAVEAEQVSLPATAAQETLGTGFERDRGPVMAQTPDLGTADENLDAPQPTSVSGSNLGPFSGLPVPPLPPATTSALPEQIGSPRLRVAASGGDTAAQFEIATRYMEGRFVPQDFAAAAHWYGLAADQGSVPAAYRLGSFYEQGRGVDRDTDSAIAWYEQSARGGNPRGMHNLAVMAAEGRGVGGATAPDFERASGWFRAAAERGLSDSQFNLAVLFARGMGVERDLLESYKWFALAANAGDSEAVGRRDEVAGVLGDEALALARARVENWQATPIDRAAVEVTQPEGGWDDAPVRASGNGEVSASQAMIAQAQALLAQRGYEPGPADGLIGPRTTDAVRAFRQSVGLGDTGTIDEALLNALSGSGNL
jgi:localization factor PodJL